MQPSLSLSVSELKNKLLEVVRQVEAGAVVEITKGGRPVAVLSPSAARFRPATGFARVEVTGSLELPEQEWSLDVENLPPPPERRR